MIDMGFMGSSTRQGRSVFCFRWGVNLAVFFSIVFPACASADDQLMGAEKAIATIEQKLATLSGNQTKKDDQDPVKQLKRDIASFAEKKFDSPKRAAEGWLALVGRYFDIPQSQKVKRDEYSVYFGDSLSLTTLFESIPGPESWPYIENGIEKYKPLEKISLDAKGLRIIVAFLRGKMTLVKNEVAQIDEIVSQLGISQREARIALDRLNTYVQRCTLKDSPDAIIENFRRILEAKKEVEGEQGTITIPDLVNLAGEQEAGRLIEQVLKIKNVIINVPSGGETLALVKQMVTARVSELDKPQWGLVNSPDDIALFEAMYEKFGGKDEQESEEAAAADVFSEDVYPESLPEDDSAKTEAELNYIFGLVKNDRLDAAAAFTLEHDLSTLPSYTVKNVWHRMNQARIADSMLQYCSRVLKKNPDLPFWGLYAKLSIALDENREYLNTLSEMSQDATLSFKTHNQIEEYRISAYLAQGDVEKALEIIRELEELNLNDLPQKVLVGLLRKRVKLGAKVANIGQLLERKDLVDAGLDIMRRATDLARPLSVNMKPYEYMVLSQEDTLVEWLVENDRLAEAEKIIVNSLESKVAKFKGRELEISLSESSVYLSDLLALVQVYSKAGRHSDVLTLLNEAPWWGKKYLSEIDSPELSHAAALALSKVGQQAEAKAVLKNQLYKSTDNDSLYSALIDMSGMELIPWLDELYATDRFEERPLIWKAVILFRAGNLDEAEKVIRQALKIDPTDGEQKAGDRVRAYAVLSDILREKGNDSEAEFFSNVVKSVRIAELGDKYKKAGLIRQSLGYYSEAEEFFGDAYCVQWRKAERLYELGKYEEANKHYEIAFERMPEQFGRVASFCFGCEGVFDKENSRSIAETVLLRLLQTNPDKPQVYFLLGQLREAQERYTDAYTFFKKAVALDSEYLDAWKRIAYLQDNIFLPQSELNSITLAMLKLDPLKKHFSGTLDKASNFEELWPVLEESARLGKIISSHERILILRESKSSIETLEEKFSKMMPEQWEMYRSFREAQRLENDNSPGSALAGHQLVRQIELLSNMQKFGF